jgi:hypothetical protein
VENQSSSCTQVPTLADVIDDFVIAMKVGYAIKSNQWQAEVLKEHMRFGDKSGALVEIQHHAAPGRKR